MLFERRGPSARDVFRRAGGAMRAQLLEALSPTRCAACERPGALVCERCLNEMPLIDSVCSCTRCGAPFGDLVCTECQGEGLPCGRCLAVATFEGPVPDIIRAYKDGGELRLAGVVAQMLADAASHAQVTAPDRYGGLTSGADGIVFVPATAEAYRRRGFDHMGRVASELSALLGIPVVDALVKHGRADQRLLGRKGRMSGAAGAYEVLFPLAGANVLLIDDVITTGSTIRAAAGALAGAGAARVDALALARVWSS